MKLKIKNYFIYLLLSLPIHLYAADYYVNDLSSVGDIYTSAIGNNTNAGTAADPFKTLWRALEVATSGDRIFIDAGLYNQNGFPSSDPDKNIVITTNNLQIIGAGSSLTIFENPSIGAINHWIKIDADNVEITGVTATKYIGTSGEGKALTIYPGSTGIVLDDITLTNNDSAGESALQIWDNTSVTIRNSNSTCNLDSGLYGGGVSIGDINFTLATPSSNISVSFENCGISNNSRAGFYGGGVYIYGDASVNVTFTDCAFTNNLAIAGGAIFIAGGAQVSVFNSCFSNNESLGIDVAETNDSGGAIYLDEGDIIIQDCSFSNNNSDARGGAISIGNNAGNTANITNSSFSNNLSNSGGNDLHARQDASLSDCDIQDIVTIGGTTSVSFCGNPAVATGVTFVNNLAPRFTANTNCPTPVGSCIAVAPCTNPDATGSNAQSFCAFDNPTVADLVADVAGGTLVWYTAASGGVSISSTTTLVNGQSYFASNDAVGCDPSLNRLEVVVTINDPSAPTNNGNLTECEESPIQTLDANDALASTVGVTWYASSSGGASIASPVLNTVGNISYFAEFNDGTCTSTSRTEVILTINDSPNPTASNGNLTECEEAPIQTLDANNALTSATGITWYDAASNGAITTPTLNTVSTKTVFAEFNDGTCSSLTRTQVVLTINDSPNPTASNGDLTECEEAPIQTLDANDALTSTTGITWYDAAINGVVTTSTLNTVGTKTVFAEFNDGTCSSLTRTQVVLTINDSPNPTASNGDLTECEEAPIQTLDANDALTSTTGITWYDAATNGAVTTSTLNTVGTKTVFAEFNDGTCSSLTRTQVVLTINDSPNPTASNGDLTECEEAPIQTLDANNALTSTTGITWYDAATNGAVTTSTLNTVGAKTVYAEFNDGTCSSLTRTQVVLTINDSPNPTASNGDLTECEEAPIQTLDANDALTSTTGITWYDAVTNGAVTTSTLNTVGTKTVYAEFNDGTCASLIRTQVVLTINDSPNPIVSNGDLSECPVAPLQTLDANDALVSTTGVTWYDAATNGNIVASPTLNTEGTITYFAEYNDGTCTSLSRRQVILTIATELPPPFSNGNLTECEEIILQTLDANDALNGSTGVTWYDASSLGNTVASPVLNTLGSTTYYAEFSDGTCTSITRTPVILTINPAPNAPTASSNALSECEENPIQTLDANSVLASATGITWFDAVTGGAVTTSTLNSVGTKTVFAEFNDGTCSSLSRTQLTLTINPAPNAPSASSNAITECEENPIQTLDANSVLASATGITWFDAATGGAITTSTLNSVGTKMVFAEFNVGTCSSLSRTQLTLTINPAPNAPSASSNAITECEENPIQTLDANSVLAGAVGITWFDAVTGGVVTTSTLNSVGTKTVFAEFNDGTCSSLSRTQVTLTINPAPNAPTASSNALTECEENPIQTLDANNVLASSTGITWFDAATGGAVTTSTLNSVGTKTVFAEFNDGTCSSLSRTQVTLTINPAPNAPNASSNVITECEENPIQTLDANSVLASATGITWFDAAINGAITSSTLNSVGTKTVFAEFNDGTCSSLTRTQVTLTLNPAPNAPVASNNAITECEQNPIQTLDANSVLASATGITWFDAAINGAITSSTLNSVGTKTVFAEFNDGTCSSLTRTQVTLTINNTPNAPSGNGNQNFCTSAVLTLNDLQITGSNILWYTSTGTPLDATTVLQDGQTYFATQTTGSCESPMNSGITVGLNSISIEITDIILANCGKEDGSITVNATGGDGPYTYSWNTGANGSSLVDLSPGTYIVSATEQSGCTATLDIVLACALPDIPEIITPSGNGKNDKWVIGLGYVYPQMSVTIYNRWGNEVYTASPYLDDWDGKPNKGSVMGDDYLPNGTYFYIIDLKDGQKPTSGYIELVR